MSQVGEAEAAIWCASPIQNLKLRQLGMAEILLQK